MSLTNFAKELKVLLNQHDKARPFICDGNPLDCIVFIVGINAATEIERDFWSSWSNKTGFNKQDWLESYVYERSIKKLNANRTRRNKLSNTRQRIEWMVNSIKPFNTLETNLFVKATSSSIELKKNDRDSQIFEFLLKTIKPQVIFIHGKEVKDYFLKNFKVELTEDKPNIVEILGIKTNVIPMKHLSRGWSERKTRETGEFIKSIVKKT